MAASSAILSIEGETVHWNSVSVSKRGSYSLRPRKPKIDVIQRATEPASGAASVKQRKSKSAAAAAAAAKELVDAGAGAGDAEAVDDTPADPPASKRAPRTPATPLQRYFIDAADFEAGVDEAGRGPMFGRVYAAAVILPRDDIPGFKPELIKDSKKYSSKKKIQEVYTMIKTHAIAYCVKYSESAEIDKLNIRHATLKAMRQAIDGLSVSPQHLLVDGCDFPCYRRKIVTSTGAEGVCCVPHICIEGGDNLYTSIAAASILAKVERDAYIEELVEKYPQLNERYNLGKNMGYGTAAHIAGIKKYGITPWHRRSFGICKGMSCTNASEFAVEDISAGSMADKDVIVATIWEDEDESPASPAFAAAASASSSSNQPIDLLDFSVLED